MLYNKESEKEEKGFLFYQDITYKPIHNKYSGTFRFAVFDTDSYNSRIYTYENDVLYAYSVPAYYYKGTRYFLLFKCKILKNLEAWLRYSQTYISNKDNIGSGLNTINGNTKSEFKIQLRCKF